jgi:hypothetical protein
MPFFRRGKDRAVTRASARLSARVNARNRAATAALKSSSSLKSTSSLKSPSSFASTGQAKKKVAFDSPTASLVSTVKEAAPTNTVVDDSDKAILIDSAVYESSSGDSAIEMADSNGVSSLGRRSQSEYNGDQIVDSLRAIHEIIEEANTVIKAYSEAPPPNIPTIVNVNSKVCSEKGKGDRKSRRNHKKVVGPTPEEEAAEAARVAEAAQESLRRRTKNVAGKSKEEVFVWATQSLMRELDLIMPTFLDKKYRVNVDTMTPEEAEILAENTEVETLMPVTSSFLRKIDKGIDAIIEREELGNELSRGNENPKGDCGNSGGDCGILEAFHRNFGGGSEKKEKKELTPAQKKLVQEIEDDDRSAIVLVADMAEEIMQSLTALDEYDETKAGEAVFTRDISYIAPKSPKK